MKNAPIFKCPTDGHVDRYAFMGWPPEGGSLVECESCADRWRITPSGDGTALIYEPAPPGWLPPTILDEQFNTVTEYDFLELVWILGRGVFSPFDMVEALDEFDATDGIEVSWPAFLDAKVATKELEVMR
jgi:hypothetical protein